MSLLLSSDAFCFLRGCSLDILLTICDWNGGMHKHVRRLL